MAFPLKQVPVIWPWIKTLRWCSCKSIGNECFRCLWIHPTKYMRIWHHSFWMVLTHTNFTLEALNCQSYRAKFLEAVATAGKFDIQTKSGLKLSKSVPPKPSNTPLSQEIQETSHPIPIKTGWFVNIPMGNIMAKPRWPHPFSLSLDRCQRREDQKDKIRYNRILH